MCAELEEEEEGKSYELMRMKMEEITCLAEDGVWRKLRVREDEIQDNTCKW